MERQKDEVLNMGGTKIKKDNGEPRFIQKNQQAFNEWWSDILNTKPTYIVAIARKGPRMLEVFNKYGKDSLRKNIYEMDNIISERAIPFMSDDEIKGSTFTVIDDILVYGSTLKTVLKNIEKRSPKSIRWATFTYDIDENKIRGLDKYQGKPKLPKTKESNAVFCDELVSSFSLLLKSYDVDHPIFYLKVKNYYLYEEILQGMLKNISIFVFNATSPQQRVNGICRFSSIFSDTDFLRYLFDDPREIDVEMSKMRLYIDLNSGDIALVPIYLFSASVETLRQISFNDKLSFLNDILRKVSKRLYDNGYEDKDIAIGMIRLHTFLIEYLYGRYFILKNKRLFDESVSFEPTHIINDFDIRILFGRSLSEEILSILSSKKDRVDSYIYEIIRKRKILNESQERTKQTGNRLSNQFLYEELFHASEYQSIRNTLFENKENADLVYNLWRIFRLMHQKDIQEREKGVDVIDRLTLGFSFLDINEILSREFNYQINKYLLSTALDYLIDRGAVVPVFAKYNGWIGRVFRFGEKINIYGLAMIFRKTLENFVNRFSEKYITKFQFEKLLTLVGGIILKRYFQYEDFDLSYYFDKEGARLNVIEREKYEAPYYLDQFCMNHNIIRRPEWLKEEMRIYLNDKFYDEYPRGTHYVDQKDLMLFSNIGGLIWDICFNSEIGKKFSSKQIFLAFTTCNDKENFLEAIKKDVELLFAYLDSAVNNLEGVLLESRKVKATPLKLGDFMGMPSKEVLSYKKKTVEECIKNVYELCRIIDEKWNAYEALEEIKEKLDIIYSPKNPDKVPLDLPWNYCREVINLFKVYERHRRMQILKKLGEQYNHMIEAVCRYVLSSKDRTAILETVKKYNSLVDKYNFSYLAFQNDDISIVRDITNKESIINVVMDKFRYLRLASFESTTKRKKRYNDYIKERGKYNINEIPGTIDDRVFVGGNYDFMLPLKEICEIVFLANFQPIFAYDFDVPEDKIKEYDIILVQNCRYAIIEATIDGGQISEFESGKHNSAEILVVYNIRDIHHQKKPSQATSMVLMDPYPKKEIKYYVSIDDLYEIINGWLARKVFKKEIAMRAGEQYSQA